MWFRNISRRVRSAVARPAPDAAGAAEALALSPQALHQLNRLQLNAGRHLSGRRVGQRSSFRRRPAHDFREHRMYVPGDDVRYVDWKASARTEHVFIRQGEQLRDATISILLDCSLSMDWGVPPKRIMAARLAAALGVAALAHSDRLIIQPLTSNGQKRLGPLSGKGQVPTLFNYLRGLDWHAPAVDLPAAVRAFTSQTAGGLVLLVSDLLAMPDLDQALELLPAPTWDVVVLHLLHPHELAPDVRGDFQMVDSETGKVANHDVNKAALQQYEQQLAAWRDELEAICAAHNVFYTLLPSTAGLSQEIIPRLRSLQVLVPL
jgi:uncharacterized protein (DUF58 family)